MTSTNSMVQQLAAELGIDPIPEYWIEHWQEYLQWKAGGGCVVPGEIVGNAQEVFGLSDECMSQVESVCAEIRMNPVLSELADLWHFLLFHMPGERGLGENVLPAPRNVLGERAPLFHIAVLVSGTEDALQAFRRLGASDQITMDSLRQCGSQTVDYMERYGVYGMRFLGWMRNYFNAKMFRLGRLVFNPNTYAWAFHVYRHKATGVLQTMCAAGSLYRTDGMADGTNGVNDPDAWTSELEIGPDFVRGNPVSPTGEAVREPITLDLKDWELLLAPGDHMIEIHIPGRNSGGRMDWADCLDSYRQALGFFPKTYPDMDFKVFTCWSWLLDPGLAKILPSESNIVKFQVPFHLLPVCGNHYQCYDLAFGNGDADLTTFQPKTSLQWAIIEYVLAGNKMHGMAGYITMDEMKAISDFGMRNAD